MIGASYDYMVGHFEFKKPPGAYQVAGHFDMGFAGGDVSTWMVFHQANSTRGSQDGQPKDFVGMDEQSDPNGAEAKARETAKV